MVGGEIVIGLEDRTGGGSFDLEFHLGMGVADGVESLAGMGKSVTLLFALAELSNDGLVCSNFGSQ